MLPAILPLLTALPLGAGEPAVVDLRDAYDVLHYELDLRVDPAERSLAGEVTTRVRVLVDQLDEIQLDLTSDWNVSSVRSGHDQPLEFERNGDSLTVRLGRRTERNEEVAVRVAYDGHPATEHSFDGFHWAETADGRPWVNTSCQGPGAHSWWPCKASYFHPDDKPDDGVTVRLTVPTELVAVSNGRLESVAGADEGWHTYHWRHPYPLETYTVTLNVAPYVVVERELALPGIDRPVNFAYYVLPENAEKAAVQFAQVPRLLEVFSEAFGPWPFPESKVGLVETNFWGMEHSTAVAYGSSYPAWCRANDAEDRYARRNRYFDYILVHEMAHEWWGNAVSAEHWGHFWIHEGFGTYAEAVWLEWTEGREVADEYFESSRRSASRDKGVLYRGDHPSSGDAYDGVIYSKGAWVLNTLRHYVDDDSAWWAAVRGFQGEHRHGNASTEDFRAVLERHTGRDWIRFFDEWVYGQGAPHLDGVVSASDHGLRVEVTNDVGTFHVPLDVTGLAAGEPFHERVWLAPGANSIDVALAGPLSDLAVVGLHRVLGKHDVHVAE